MFQFKDFDYLTDGEIDLRIEEKVPANEEKGYVPSYKYRITLHDSDDGIGAIDIRIGYNENLCYGGNIGYGIEEAYRGNNYAAKACKIIKEVAVAHGMTRLIITCNPENIPSRKTCEIAGLKLKEIVDLPPYNDMYLEGERQKCVYEWILINKIDLFWNRFLEARGYDKNKKYIDVFHFELTEYLANQLLNLVLEGKKKATCSSLVSYELEGERVPEIGDLSVITDWDGNPRCVIETKEIIILPFKDITYDICKREGEDECLETWREGHARFFKEDGKELGYEFTEDLLVIFEDFEVIYQEEIN